MSELICNDMKLHLEKILRNEIADQLQITGIIPVTGGDIHQAFRVNTTNGRFFLKVNKASSADIFRKEYHGLQLLAATAALKVPAPLSFGQFGDCSFLLLEWLERKPGTEKDWGKLGAGIAALHRVSDVRFGLDENNYLATLHQDNTCRDTWSQFYTENRLMPLGHSLAGKGLLTAADMDLLGLVCSKMAGLMPLEPPALLHGDLWHGNTMFVEEGPAIFDPAVYYGHRETDIAMTLLFAGFDQHFYDAYNETYPLCSGWEDRTALFQLYPLLVHLKLFGASYHDQVKEILNRYA
ncbi:MAG: hypothetical protein EOP49_18655 [Sphingobacteriales bacterium]|nr:MAG: hypothetical protein EOP49_18655 [Sphingobacteriales bacterium]